MGRWAGLQRSLWALPRKPQVHWPVVPCAVKPNDFSACRAQLDNDPVSAAAVERLCERLDVYEVGALTCSLAEQGALI
jgi:hypothetical protein